MILYFPKQLLSWMGFSILARNGLCSLMICWLLLVPPGSPFFSLLLSSLFPQERASVPSWFAGSSCFGLGFRCLSPFFSMFFSPRIWRSKTEDRSVPDSSKNFELHMTLVETCVVAVWGLCWCNFRKCKRQPVQYIPCSHMFSIWDLCRRFNGFGNMWAAASQTTG